MSLGNLLPPNAVLAEKLGAAFARRDVLAYQQMRKEGRGPLPSFGSVAKALPHFPTSSVGPTFGALTPKAPGMTLKPVSLPRFSSTGAPALPLTKPSTAPALPPRPGAVPPIPASRPASPPVLPPAPGTLARAPGAAPSTTRSPGQTSPGKLMPAQAPSPAAPQSPQTAPTQRAAGTVSPAQPAQPAQSPPPSSPAPAVPKDTPPAQVSTVVPHEHTRSIGELKGGANTGGGVLAKTKTDVEQANVPGQVSPNPGGPGFLEQSGLNRNAGLKLTTLGLGLGSLYAGTQVAKHLATALGGHPAQGQYGSSVQPAQMPNEYGQVS